LDAATEQVVYLRAQLRDERAYAERLQAQIATMAERQVPVPVELPERTRDEVIDAIIGRAGNNGQLRAHLAAWAMKQRREHVPDDQIIQGIVVWASPDEDGAS
jgi:hypothetical protein